MTDFKAKMHQIRFRLGSDPAGGAYSAPPDETPWWIWGPLRGRGWAVLRNRRERWKGREGEVEGREREGPQVNVEPGPLRVLLRHWVQIRASEVKDVLLNCTVQNCSYRQYCSRLSWPYEVAGTGFYRRRYILQEASISKAKDWFNYSFYTGVSRPRPRHRALHVRLYDKCVASFFSSLNFYQLFAVGLKDIFINVVVFLLLFTVQSSEPMPVGLLR